MKSKAAAPINASTELLGVIGQPIHSLSPVMHNAALAELGLNWRYLAFAVAPDRLQQAIEGLAAPGLPRPQRHHPAQRNSAAAAEQR